MRLHDKVALVTGAGSGIGRATALRFAAEGALVAALDRDESSVQATAVAIGAQGGRALPVVTDVAQAASVRGAVEQVLAAWGRLDAVFNGVGASGRRYGDGPVDQCTEEGWDWVL